jgi:hypothetical protein
VDDAAGFIVVDVVAAPVPALVELPAAPAAFAFPEGLRNENPSFMILYPITFNFNLINWMKWKVKVDFQGLEK